MARVAALALLIFSLMVGDAQATQLFHVYVVDRPLQDVPDGAEGLLVPGAGPETSFAQALASLERGQVRNSLRGGLPAGPALIEVSSAQSGLQKPYILVSLPRGGTQPNDRRYPVVVVGNGYQGILVSDSTRIPGLVSIVDIAPTALGEKGALRSQPEADSVAALRDLDARLDGHNDSRLPASIVAAVLILVLALVWPRAALLAFGAVLSANLLLGALGAGPLWATIVIGLAAAVGGPLLALVLRSDLAIGAFLAGVLVAYLAALGLRGPWVSLSPFDQTGNGRFYGISNLPETMLLVPAFGGAAFLWRRLGWPAFVAVALTSFVAISGNRFGADGGGAIVLAVGFAVLGALLAELRGRALLAAVGAVVALAFALLALDAATGASSHVTKALGGGPAGLLRDLRDRIDLSWQRIAQTPSIAAVVVVCLPIFVVLVIRLLRSNAPLTKRALPLAFAAAIGVSLIVNDSPNDVLAAGLVGYVTVEAVMLRDRCAPLQPSPGSSPGSPSSLPVAAQRRP
jgi:hypothetical protein